MNTITKTTHIEVVQDGAYKNMLQVCAYLGWSEAQYNVHQLEQYEAFLKRRFAGKKVEELNKVRYSPLMAGFWKNEWRLRVERDFLPFASEMCTETMHVNELGHFIHYVPSDADYATVYDEYMFLNDHRQLLNDAEFGAQVTYVIDLI